MAKATTSVLLSALISQIEHKRSTPETIKGAWHLAARHKDIEAMATIAGADDLPEDVLNAVKARVEIPIAVSYLTRDGLDIEERRARFTAEERAGVLAGCLESPSLTDDDREIIGAKLIAKPTRVLAEAIVNEGSMPAASVIVAISQLDGRYDSLTEDGRKNLRKQVLRIAGDSEYAPKLAPVLNNRELASRFLEKQPAISEAEFSDIFKRTVEPAIESQAGLHQHNRSTYRVANLLRGIAGENGEYMNNPMLAALRRHYSDEDVAKIWTDVVGATRAVTATAATSEYSTKIVKASTTSDPSELDELITEAINNEPALLDPLANNAAVSAEQFRRFVAHLDDSTVVRAMLLHPGDDEFLYECYRQAFSLAVRRDGWKSFTNPVAAKERVLEHFLQLWYQQGSNSPYYSSESRMLAEVVDQIGNDMELLERLPWEFVHSSISSYNGDLVAQVFTELQTKLLGDDVKKWETAEVLAANFTGSVHELFNTAAKL
jgi:hypothetical protein